MFNPAPLVASIMFLKKQQEIEEKNKKSKSEKSKILIDKDQKRIR